MRHARRRIRNDSGGHRNDPSLSIRHGRTKMCDRPSDKSVTMFTCTQVARGGMRKRENASDGRGAKRVVGFYDPRVGGNQLPRGDFNKTP